MIVHFSIKKKIKKTLFYEPGKMLYSGLYIIVCDYNILCARIYFEFFKNNFK